MIFKYFMAEFIVIFLFLDENSRNRIFEELVLLGFRSHILGKFEEYIEFTNIYKTNSRYGLVMSTYYFIKSVHFFFKLQSSSQTRERNRHNSETTFQGVLKLDTLRVKHIHNFIVLTLSIYTIVNDRVKLFYTQK